jgi:hypothetical protein
MRGRARAHKDASGQACSSREEGGRLMDIFTVALHYSVSVVYSGTVVCVGLGDLWRTVVAIYSIFTFDMQNDISMNFDIVKKMMPT